MSLQRWRPTRPKENFSPGNLTLQIFSGEGQTDFSAAPLGPPEDVASGAEATVRNTVVKSREIGLHVLQIYLVMMRQKRSIL